VKNINLHRQAPLLNTFKYMTELKLTDSYIIGRFRYFIDHPFPHSIGILWIRILDFRMVCHKFHLQETKVVKIRFKISVLVLSSLLILGIIMGVLATFQVNDLGRKSLETLNRKLREDFDTLAKSQVEQALSVVQMYYDQREVLGEEESRKLALQAIDAMRYGENGYIFIYDSQGITISLPDKSVVGTNRWDLQDANGDYIVRELIKAAKEGDGFSVYYYNKPGESTASPKRSFTGYFSPWDWIIGTGNYIDDIDALVLKEQVKIDGFIKRIIMILLMADISVIILAFIIARILGARISSPVEELVKDVEMIAGGDLTVDIFTASSDETKVLSEALSNMVQRLRKTVGGIMSTSLSIMNNAQEVAAASQQVATGASEQASSAEEISASMEELSANIQQNTENSRESNSIVSKAAGDADSSGTSVEETVNSMKFISSKIKIIEEIARNTNLLALNAAIEAARAGDAGKGFAVVASEVRKLAENSQNAANDITNVASESVKKADATLELMRSIVPSIKKSAEIAEEIFEGSHEQARGADQINQALLQMDKVIQSNAASSEEIASMADMLKEKSVSLSKLVSFFRIGDVEDQIRMEHTPEVKNRKNPESHGHPGLLKKTALLETGQRPAQVQDTDDDKDDFTEF